MLQINEKTNNIIIKCDNCGFEGNYNFPFSKTFATTLVKEIKKEWIFEETNLFCCEFCKKDKFSLHLSNPIKNIWDLKEQEVFVFGGENVLIGTAEVYSESPLIKGKTSALVFKNKKTKHEWKQIWGFSVLQREEGKYINNNLQLCDSCKKKL